MNERPLFKVVSSVERQFDRSFCRLPLEIKEADKVEGKIQKSHTAQRRSSTEL